MNSIIQNIKSRRSIRNFKNKVIPKHLLEEIIESARFAPSSHNSQPWNFIIIRNEKKINNLSNDIKKWYVSTLKITAPLLLIKDVRKSALEMKKRAQSGRDLFFYHAPCVIIIHAPDRRFFLQDCCCAAQNIMLAARSLDIGSCWIGFADIALNNSRKMKKALKIPFSNKVMATIILGFTEKFPAQALPRKEHNQTWIK
jgi:nitroreductase